MIAVFVTFDPDSLDEERVRKVAAEARGMFEGMASLRTKFFTLDEKKAPTRVLCGWCSRNMTAERMMRSRPRK